MKATRLEDLPGKARELRGEHESLLVYDGPEPIGVFQPLPDPSDLPLEVRRKLFVESATKLRAQLDAQGITDEQIDRDIAAIRKNRR